MGVEPKRGCGYRRIGGLYLVGNSQGRDCDRLPFPLTVCPTCSAGFKRSRAPAWIDINGLFEGPHKVHGIPCACAFNGCPLCEQPEKMGKGFLLWVGTKYYPTTTSFLKEGEKLGFSRRIAALPKGFVLGKTYVLLAHAKAIETLTEVKQENLDGQAATLFPAVNSMPVFERTYTPGLFHFWIPSAIEKILPESQRNSGEAERLVKRGIRPIFVPDADPDHAASTENEQEESLFT